jgi:hypothetical protein
MTAIAMLFGLSTFAAPSTADAHTCAYAPEAPPICSESISGVVVWADGRPAGGMRIKLVPNTPGAVPGTYAAYAGAAVEVHTDVGGHYEARVCPCAALMGFLEIGDDLNCQIVMGAVTPLTTDADLSSLRAYNGVQAEPGDRVQWSVGGTACRDDADTVTPGTITQAWLDGSNPGQDQALSRLEVRDRELELRSQ